MTMTDRIAEVLQAELDEHGCEDDDEKRWQIARHWAEKVAELFTEETHTYINYKTKAVSGGEGIFRYAGQISQYKGQKTVRRWVSDWHTDD